jgi:hypothetical protein
MLRPFPVVVNSRKCYILSIDPTSKRVTGNIICLIISVEFTRQKFLPSIVIVPVAQALANPGLPATEYFRIPEQTRPFAVKNVLTGKRRYVLPLPESER